MLTFIYGHSGVEQKKNHVLRSLNERRRAGASLFERHMRVVGHLELAILRLCYRYDEIQTVFCTNHRNWLFDFWRSLGTIH